MKIHVPDSLRRQIENCQTRLSEMIQSEAEQRTELTGKIEQYKSEEKQLSSHIEMLKGRILTDADAANKIPALDLRLGAVRSELQRLERELEGIQPVSLAFTQPVLQTITAHWNEVFPGAFADYAASAFHNRNNAINVAKLTDVIRYLGVIINRSYNLDFSLGNVEFVTAIFRRALLGQPYLGVDIPEPETK